ncbi:helix-hairpin-helix domain-containing protein [Streptomyces sp. NPDC001339]|uniref:helix-hairpin-helix domain-containing protein n=1 Tax=Streptomyces sp. NPDC001339 TaxID=3364563 RepID=UPI0036D16702
MSTDRRAAETPPEQEGAAGTADAPGTDTATGHKPPAAAAPAKATAAALAAAVRAVERGERSAASFFAEAPRPAGPAAPPGNGAPPAARGPAEGAPAPGGPGPQAGPAVPSGAAPEAARQHPSHHTEGPARPPVPTDATAITATPPVGTGAVPPETPLSGHAAPPPADTTTPATVPATSAPPRPAVAAAPGLDGVRQVLAAGGAPEALAERTAEVLGERAAEALGEDPWQLLAVPGVRPEQADGFARALLGPAAGPDDERRAQALIGWLLEQAALAGHSALEAAALRAALAQRAVPDPDDALQTAIADGSVLVFQDAIDEPGRAHPATADDEEEEPPVRLLLALDRYAMAEESVADGLGRLLNTFEPPSDAEDDAEDIADTENGGTGTTNTHEGAENTDKTQPPGEAEPHEEPHEKPLEEPRETDAPGDGPPAERSGTAPLAASPSPADWEAAAVAAPSPSAAELIRATALSGLVTHTGAEAARAEPAALITAARSLGLRAFGATHTENGRRRLAAHLAQLAPGEPAQESTTANPTTAAVTVSGLLSGRQGPGRDEDGTLALDLLVVLDAPQLDLETAALLVESLTDGTRLVLSGDPGVLWSTGPGRLFADLLAARFCPQVASRTPDFGPIGELVSGIGIGELNEVEAPGKEVVIVPVRDAGEAVHRTVQLVADSVPRALGLPADQTQVITVGHGGAAGTRALNTALKERLNPGPGRFGGFDPGDRIAYTPAPGRTVSGTVTGADATGLNLDCAGSAVVVPREQVEAGAVRHGWALTAHQAAGSRWPAAVVVLPGDATGGLTRAWVYTAFSRGERHLSVVQGADQALPHAVTSLPAKERTTRLRTLLHQTSHPEPTP